MQSGAPTDCPRPLSAEPDTSPKIGREAIGRSWRERFPVIPSASFQADIGILNSFGPILPNWQWLECVERAECDRNNVGECLAGIKFFVVCTRKLSDITL